MNTKLLFICFVFALPVYSQTNSMVTVGDTIVVHKHIKPSFTFGGSLGCSIPKEGYGLTPSNYGLYNVIQPGFADAGFYLNINLECHLCKHFGLMLETNGNINPLDRRFYNDGTIEKSDGGTGGTYYVGTILAGPFYSVTFKNGNIFETRLLMGFIELYQSAITYGWSSGGVDVPLGMPAYADNGFSAAFGAKFKFHFTKGTYLTIDASYTQAFNYMYNEPLFLGRATEPGESMGILNTGLGVEFKL